MENPTHSLLFCSDIKCASRLDCPWTGTVTPFPFPLPAAPSSLRPAREMADAAEWDLARPFLVVQLSGEVVWRARSGGDVLVASVWLVVLALALRLLVDVGCCRSCVLYVWP
jgi:hypothetical protein